MAIWFLFYLYVVYSILLLFFSVFFLHFNTIVWSLLLLLFRRFQFTRQEMASTVHLFFWRNNEFQAKTIHQMTTEFVFFSIRFSTSFLLIPSDNHLQHFHFRYCVIAKTNDWIKVEIVWNSLLTKITLLRQNQEVRIKFI